MAIIRFIKYGAGTNDRKLNMTVINGRRRTGRLSRRGRQSIRMRQLVGCGVDIFAFHADLNAPLMSRYAFTRGAAPIITAPR